MPDWRHSSKTVPTLTVGHAHYTMRRVAGPSRDLTWLTHRVQRSTVQRNTSQAGNPTDVLTNSTVTTRSPWCTISNPIDRFHLTRSLTSINSRTWQTVIHVTAATALNDALRKNLRQQTKLNRYLTLNFSKFREANHFSRLLACFQVQHERKSYENEQN